MVTGWAVFIQWEVADFVDWYLANLCHFVSIHVFPIISCLFWFKFESGFLSNHFLMTALSGFYWWCWCLNPNLHLRVFPWMLLLTPLAFWNTSACVSHRCFKLRTVNMSLYGDPSLSAAPCLRVASWSPGPTCLFPTAVFSSRSPWASLVIPRLSSPLTVLTSACLLLRLLQRPLNWSFNFWFTFLHSFLHSTSN